MAVKKNFLKIGYILLSLLVLYTLGHYAFDRFIRRELPKIIAEKNHTPYNFTYTEISYSLALRKLTLEGLTITPKNDSLITNKTKLNGTISSIVIQGVEIWTLIKERKLNANYITLNKPTLILCKGLKDSTQTKKSLAKTNEINLSQINIVHGKLQFIDSKTQQTNTSLDNVNIAINGVKFDTTNHQGLPFSYEQLHIQWDTLYHLINEKQYLTTQKTKLTKHQLDIQHFKVYTNENIAIKDREPILWVPDLNLTGIQLTHKDQFKLTIDEAKANALKVAMDTSTKEQPKTNITANKEIEPKNDPIELTIHHITIDSIQAKKDNNWTLSNLNISLKEFRKTGTDTIHIQSLTTRGGWLQLQANNKKKKNSTATRNKQVLHLPIITIDSINTTNTRLSIRNNKKEILDVDDINTTLRNLVINKQSVRKQIPFTFTSSYLKANKITHRTNKHYELKIESLVKDNQQLSLTEFSYLPTLSRQGMVKTFKYADDIFWIKAKDIKISDYKLNWDEIGTPLFYAKRLMVNQVNANILRDKTPPHNMSNKPLFSKKLRDLKIGITIDQTLIKNSLLIYEETSPKAIAPGKLTFGQFNASINHLVSGYNKRKVPNTTIAVDAQFMNAAPLHVDWSFNVMNKTDNFRIKGNIKDFPAGAMKPFLQPYIKASTEGSIDVVTFDFNGNAQSATGDFGIKYHDLKVSLYRKNGKVKRRTLSAIGNLIIHNNSKGDVKNVSIKEVQKVEEKSFFNYLWLCILQGLRQTIL